MRLPIEEFRSRTAGMWDEMIVDWRPNVLSFRVYREIQKEMLSMDSANKIAKEVQDSLLNVLVRTKAEADKAWLVKSTTKFDKHVFLNAKDQQIHCSGKLFLGPHAPVGLEVDEISTVMDPLWKRMVREYWLVD